jgi:hypothetical protein
MCSLKCNEPGAGIVLMKLDELHSFEEHPFKVERNQELFKLRGSIEKKRAELKIREAKKEVKVRIEKMRDIEYFWGMGYITVILFAIAQNDSGLV